MLPVARIETGGRSPVALGLTAGPLLPQQGGESGAGIGKQGVAADQVAQLPLGPSFVSELEGGQGGTGAGHGKTRPGQGSRLKAAARFLPIAQGALHVAEVVEGRGPRFARVAGGPLQDPAVVGLGGGPITQGLLGRTPVEMGIGALAIEGDGLGLVGNGRAGIAQGQQHVAPVAPGRRIVWGHLQHLVPEGQGLGEAPLPAGTEGLVKELGQQQLHPQQQSQQGGDHERSPLMPRLRPANPGGCDPPR